MRKILALATLMALPTVHAAETLQFGDLNYFLKTNQKNVSLDASSTFQKQTIEGGSTYETRGYLFESRFGYGINDQLNVYLGLDYAFDREVEDKTTASNADYHQDGLANPLIAANYRLLNQNSSDFNFDLGAVLRVGLWDSEAGSSSGQDSEDGNFMNPGHSLEVNARIGKKWNEANEWQVSAGAVANTGGDQTANLTSGDEDYSYDPSMDLFVKAAYQYRPVENFMMLVSLQATRVGGVDGENKDTDTDYNYDAHYDMDFRFTAKYLIDDGLIAKFNFGQSRNQNYDVEVGGTDVELKKRRENFFGLGIDYLF